MSDTPPAPSGNSFWRPFWFLSGLALCALVLVWSGRRVQREDFHGQFLRFHPLISPEARYQPTIDEMCSIVRARCRPDQILVLIGGNSVLNGVAQAPEKLWSVRLQELLGDRFCVVNFALRGGAPGDAACVVSEVLGEEYPRQILIVNSGFWDPADPIGSDPYRYLIEAAYDQGRLMDFPGRTEHFGKVWPFRPLHVNYAFNRLDGWTGFRTYWNKVAWTTVSTVPFDLVPKFPAWATPRGLWPDSEPDFDERPLSERYLPQFFDIEMKVARAASEAKMERTAEGLWRVKADSRNAFEAFSQLYRPPSLRPKTLVLIGRTNPYYFQHYTAEEAERETVAQKTTVEAWESMSYGALGYGNDFTAEDYYDRTHLVGRGGRKLAEAVSVKVRSMAQALRYE